MGEKRFAKNPDHEKAKEEEEKKMMKKFLPDKFFGDSALDPRTKMVPWYSMGEKSNEKYRNTKKRKRRFKKKEHFNDFYKKYKKDSKIFNDPLELIKQFRRSTKKRSCFTT